jgi:hypothetical protein
MANIKFGSYDQFKVTDFGRKVNYRYPWDKVVATGRDYGFFVGCKDKPAPPKTLKNRKWEILPAMDEGERGWYVYLKNYTNGYKPES